MQIQLNKNDILLILEAINTRNLDSVTVIRHGESSIGYCLDLEFKSGEKETTRLELVGFSDW